MKCEHCSRPLTYDDGQWHDGTPDLATVCEESPEGQVAHSPKLVDTSNREAVEEYLSA